MNLLLNVCRFLAAASSILVGSLAIIAGENDDSPGLQGLGLILIISIFVVLYITRSWTSSKAKIALKPIGIVESSRKKIVDDNWDQENSKIVLSDSISPSSLVGLDTFSHCLVVYFFDRANFNNLEELRHPRGNTKWPKVGIFAQRAKDRPNRLGVTVCRVLRVDGSILHVSGLDAIDGTPVIDIKPWMVEFGPRGEVVQPSWSSELMKGYW